MNKLVLCFSLLLSANLAHAFDEASFVGVAMKYAVSDRIVERDDEGYRGILVYPSGPNKMLYFMGYSINYERSNSSAVTKHFPEGACSRAGDVTVCDDKSLFLMIKDYPKTKQAISIQMNRVQVANGFNEADIDNIRKIFSSVTAEIK